MASAIKDKLSSMANRSSPESSDDNAAPVPTQKYMLKVTAGASYEDSLDNTIVVNGDDCVLSDKLRVAVKIREYQGIPNQSIPQSDYFKDPSHTKDTHSVSFTWVPEEDVSAEDLVWGMELVNPIRDHIPSRFITTAFEICKRFVDSSLSCDPYADQPWVNGAILCGSAMTFRIGTKQERAPPTVKVLSEGGDGDGEVVRQDYSIPSDEGKRRKFFANEGRRREFQFERGRCYHFEFHNGYIDWSNYALKLPGFSLNVLRWINERTHTLRYVMKNRTTGKPYFVVTFRLLFGEELKKEIADQGQKNKNDETRTSMGLDEKADNASSGTATKVDGHRENDGFDHQPTNSSATSQSTEKDNSARKKETEPIEIEDHASSTPAKKDALPQDSLKDYTQVQQNSSNVNKENEAAPDGVDSEKQDASAEGVTTYKHSIEESLCNTASADARNKPTNFLDRAT